MRTNVGLNSLRSELDISRSETVPCTACLTMCSWVWLSSTSWSTTQVKFHFSASASPLLSSRYYFPDLQTLMPNSLPLSKLKHLVLSNNQLEDVPTVALRHLRELDHLNLGQNNISVLQEGAFATLSRVTRLTLYDNKIFKIHRDAFDGLVK